MESNRNNKLAKNTIIILFSKVLTQLSSLLILPFLTSFLTTKEYGTFDLINNYAWLLVPYISLEIENGIFRFLIDKRKDTNNNSIKSLLSTGVLVILKQILFSFIVFVVVFLIFHRISIFYVYIYAVFSAILNLFLFIARGLGKNEDYAVASIIAGLLNICIAVITIYFFKLGILGLVISGVLSCCIASLYLFIKLHLYTFLSIKSFDNDEKKKLVKYSIPLVPNATCSWLTSVSDRTMLTILSGASANGIYSAATKFSTLITHLIGVFNLSWSEAASESEKDTDRDVFFSRTIDSIFFLCFSVCLMMTAVMPIVFKFFINERYNDSFNYVPFLMIGSLFEIFSTLLGSIYISLKKSKNIAASTLIAALVNILINILFMKKYGIIVACISTIISFMFLSIYRYIDIRKIVKLDINFKKYILCFATFFVIAFLYRQNDIYTLSLSILIAGSFSIYINKAIIIAIISKTKRMFFKIKN